MTSLFKAHTLDEQTQSLAAFLPGGAVFESKNTEGSNLHGLLRGLAGELRRIEDALIQMTDQYDPRTTTSLITEWERFVGIPDKCFPGTGDIETRRKHVVVKAGMAVGVNTEQDYIDLAAFLGYAITLHRVPETPMYPPFVPGLKLDYGIEESRFLLIIVGANINPNAPPYDLPYDFPLETQGVIPCLFDLLKPANTRYLYSTVDPDFSVYRITEEGIPRATEEDSLRIIEDDTPGPTIERSTEEGATRVTEDDFLRIIETG